MKTGIEKCTEAAAVAHIASAAAAAAVAAPGTAAWQRNGNGGQRCEPATG